MSPPDRPNVLLIMTDQHRHDFLGCAGASWLNTPNIDALAARGTRLTHAFTNSPVCGPARCAFATGLQAHRAGVMSNRHTFALSQPTLYQRLQHHGVWTGFTGKLDLAKPAGYPYPDGRSPITMAMGFCEPHEVGQPFRRYLEGRGLWDAYKEDQKARVPFPGMHGVLALRPTPRSRQVVRPAGWVTAVSQDSPLGFDDHKDSYTGRHAAAWIRDHAPDAHPWFYQVNFGGPHDPFDPVTEFAERYRDADVPDAIPADFAGKPDGCRYRFITDDADEVRHTRRQYSAMIELLDHWVGEMMESLDARGWLDHTVVIFTSDHGEMLGDHGLYTKHVPYEASIRIPMIAAGPGVAAGRTSDALAELIDLNATIADLAGLPPAERTDARSLVPLLAGETETHRDDVFTQEHHFVCVRDRRYKYAQHENDIDELYDLEADPTEQRNLALDDDLDMELYWGVRRRLEARIKENAWHR